MRKRLLLSERPSCACVCVCLSIQQGLGSDLGRNAVFRDWTLSWVIPVSPDNCRSYVNIVFFQLITHHSVCHPLCAAQRTNSVVKQPLNFFSNTLIIKCILNGTLIIIIIIIIIINSA